MERTAFRMFVVAAAVSTLAGTAALAGTISGTVSEDGTGTPLVGVEVNIYYSHGAVVETVLTDGGGVYTSSPGLPTGDYLVQTANTQGYYDELYDDIPCAGPCDVTVGAPVAVVTGAPTTGIDFALVDGRMMIFEANACMWFLGRGTASNKQYQYLDPYKKDLRRAIKKMLLQA